MIGRLLRALALILALSIAGTVFAHGVVIEHRLFSEEGTVWIEIHADFDSGDPMAEAQVAVFAPDDLANPWRTGQMDAEGNFRFEPDLSIPGTWDVRVRKAGHGDMVHIEVTGDEAELLGTETGLAGGHTPRAETETEQPAAVSAPIPLVADEQGDSDSVMSGDPLLRTAPLVQIVVNDGSVVVADARVPLDARSISSGSVVSGYSTVQIVVMAVCVIWGFVGTALFLASRGRG